MAVNYLKKKKMHAILCDIFGIAPKMIDTNYRFYRGTEWLQYSREGKFYEICVMGSGNYLSAESCEYDYYADKYVNTQRTLYNGFGKYTYPIAEKAGA